MNFTCFVLQIERIAAMAEIQLTQEHGDRLDEIAAIVMNCVEQCYASSTAT